MTRCPKCHTPLPAPAPHPDGLPGTLYDICHGCGWSRAITRKPRKEKLA